MQARQSLVIAFIGNPDLAEIAVEIGPPRIVENGQQGLARQTPPLRPQMRHQPGRHLAPHTDQTLQLDKAVEQPALAFPGKREPQGESFAVQTTHRPGHVAGGDAFDEIGVRARIQIGLQFADGSQGQTGPRG